MLCKLFGAYPTLVLAGLLLQVLRLYLNPLCGVWCQISWALRCSRYV
jgi:hypothetical protein